jgi:hypothetical protein
LRVRLGRKCTCRVLLTETRLISHTPTFACPVIFFEMLADARIAEMPFQNRGWDHVCKMGGQEERAFVLAESCM